MLSYVDRIQIVVPDRKAAVERWKALFGAERVGEDESPLLGAKRTTVRAGATEFEFLEPHDPGRISRFAAGWTSGLYGVGFSTPDVDEIARHFDKLDVAYREEDGRLYLAEEMTHGMPTVISADGSREPAGKAMRFVYEVTNPVADAKATTAHYVRIFGLDATRFSPIESHNFGYDGTLTLFNPPDRLDRIEVTRTSGGGAMDRFYHRRGASLYMCYIEADDVPALAARLEANQCRYALSEQRDPTAGLFIHPSALFGMLMGVSRRDFAWVWSGRPWLAGKDAERVHAEN